MKYLVNRWFVPVLFLIDVIGYIFFFWKRFATVPKNPKKILLIRLEHIGDMVMALPAIHSVKKSFPKAQVHVLCRDLTKPLVENDNNVDKIFCYDAPWFLHRKTKRSLFSVIRQLRAEDYDLVFEMHGDPRNLFLAAATGAYVVGYGCRGGGFFANKLASYKYQHTIAQNLDLVCSVGSKRVKAASLAVSVPFSKLQKKFNLPKKYTVINPLSGRPEKNLTVKEVQKAISSAKCPVILTGGANEVAFNSQFVGVLDLTGKTMLPELVEIVRHASLIIAPDTGIVHIAHAVGTPCKAIYKVTDTKVWGYDD